MKSSTSLRTVSLVSVSAAATTLLIQACGGGAVADTANEIDPIVGVWVSEVTVKDCASAAVLASFKGQSMFNHGGTMETGSTQPPSSGSATFGTWKRDPAGTYAVNFVFFRFNPDGTPAGTQEVRQVRTLSRDAMSYTAVITRQLLDMSGAVVDTGCASETGTRKTW